MKALSIKNRYCVVGAITQYCTLHAAHRQTWPTCLIGYLLCPVTSPHLVLTLQSVRMEFAGKKPSQHCHCQTRLTRLKTIDNTQYLWILLSIIGISML